MTKIARNDVRLESLTVVLTEDTHNAFAGRDLPMDGVHHKKRIAELERRIEHMARLETLNYMEALGLLKD